MSESLKKQVDNLLKKYHREHGYTQERWLNDILALFTEADKQIADLNEKLKQMTEIANDFTGWGCDVFNEKGELEVKIADLKERIEHLQTAHSELDCEADASEKAFRELEGRLQATQKHFAKQPRWQTVTSRKWQRWFMKLKGLVGEEKGEAKV